MDPQKEKIDEQEAASHVRFGTISPVAHKVRAPVVEFSFAKPKAPHGESHGRDSQEAMHTSCTPPPPIASPTPSDSRKSWSGLFETPTSSLYPSPIKVTSAPDDPELSNARGEGERGGGGGELLMYDLPELTFTWRSLQMVRPLKPRGLSNYGNMCFLNSILQSLLHCPPLVNTFIKLKDRLEVLTLDQVPFLKAMSELYSQHESFGDGEGTAFYDRLPPITPEVLYDCLRARSAASAFQGAQEDAQEFLTFLLDQLHEELLATRKLIRWRFAHASDSDNGRDSNTSGEWFEMGKGQRVSLARTMELSMSPISFLFFGRFRSVVQRSRAKDSVTTEPFHCVSLDIGDELVGSVEEALVRMTKAEVIDERITKTIMMESAPPVLIIQLKRFVYNHRLQGVEKLSKCVSYPETLELDRRVLHSDSLTKRPPSYRLFSVIYHHGRGADGGHYTCHARQSLNPADPWILYDDTSFCAEPLEKVLSSKGTYQSAYLLLYIRIRERTRTPTAG